MTYSFILLESSTSAVVYSYSLKGFILVNDIELIGGFYNV